MQVSRGQRPRFEIAARVILSVFARPAGVLMTIWSSLRTKVAHTSRRKGPGRRVSRPILRLEALEDRCLLSANLWTQRGGDAGHTAYVDTSLNAAGITAAWNQPIGYLSSGYWAQNGNRGVAIDATRVYRTELEGYWASGNYHIMAYDLQTGAPLWNRIIVGNGPVSAPSIANGLVYINRSGHSGISGGTPNDLPYLYALNSATGNTSLQTNYAAQWESDERPAIFGNQLIAWDGYYGGFSSWNNTNLVRQWNNAGSIYDPPLAAFDSQYVYAYNSKVYNRTTGAYVHDIAGPTGFPWIADPMVSGSGKVFFEVRNDQYYPNTYCIAAYTGVTHRPTWSRTLRTGAGAKAGGNGIVAGTAGTQLLILNDADGSLLRTWTAQDYLTTDIVLTHTHAFVECTGYYTGRATVYAINLATGQAEWSYQNNIVDENSSATMEIALGGDYLILSHDGFVRAFNVAGGPVNQPPDAVNDSATTAEDTLINVNVLANDTDPDGNALTVTAVTQPAHGSAVINADMTVK